MTSWVERTAEVCGDMCGSAAVDGGRDAEASFNERVLLLTRCVVRRQAGHRRSARTARR